MVFVATLETTDLTEKTVHIGKKIHFRQSQTFLFSNTESTWQNMFATQTIMYKQDNQT